MIEPTIRERVAMALCQADNAPYTPCECSAGHVCADELHKADIAIAIVVDAYRNGQASLLDLPHMVTEERDE